MNATGITSRIFNFANAIMGHLPGGLGHVNVLGSVIFSGMSGSALADVSGLGLIEIKAMRDAGTMTISVSPSRPLPRLSVRSSRPACLRSSTARWPPFRSGGSSSGASSRSPDGRGPVRPRCILCESPELPPFRRVFFQRAAGCVVSLLSPLVNAGDYHRRDLDRLVHTHGGRRCGLFLCAVLGVYYREMTWDRVSATLKEIVDVSIPALFILAAANLFSWIIAIEQIPQIAAAAMLGITQNKYLILLIINILLLFVGCFLPRSLP